jgi:hypothetical protein
MSCLRVCLVVSLLMGFTGSSHGATPVRETVAAQVMGRLGARSEIIQTVIEALPETP